MSNSKKYHVSDDGIIRLCEANKIPCSKGGHYASEEEGYRARNYGSRSGVVIKKENRPIWDQLSIKDKKTVTNLVKSIYGEDFTLETQMSDDLDVHEMPVWGIRELLQKSFYAGAHAADKRPPQIEQNSLDSIATGPNEYITTLETQNSDQLDFPEVPVQKLRNWIAAAYMYGKTAPEA